MKSIYKMFWSSLQSQTLEDKESEKLREECLEIEAQLEEQNKQLEQQKNIFLEERMKFENYSREAATGLTNFSFKETLSVSEKPSQIQPVYSETSKKDVTANNKVEPDRVSHDLKYSMLVIEQKDKDISNQIVDLEEAQLQLLEDQQSYQNKLNTDRHMRLKNT